MIKYLKKLGFQGPYPHGEYYLYDESCKNEVIVSHRALIDKENWYWVRVKYPEEWSCIMCVTPNIDGKGNHQAEYNAQRGRYCDKPDIYQVSGFIDFSTKEELDQLIIKSKNLDFNQ